MSSPALRGFYRHLLYLYPANFRAEYGEEIQMVFELSIESKRGLSVGWLLLRELASAPHVLLSLHWREWKRRGWQSVFLASHAPVRDGRHSWALAWAEGSFFMLWAGLMVLLTYGDSSRISPGWYRDLSLIGILAVILPLPILLLGLGRAAALGVPILRPAAGLPGLRWIALPPGLVPGSLASGHFCIGGDGSLGKCTSPSA